MNDYWRKAMIASKSARILLDSGDIDGATSRAYYAMFDAAKAALEAIDPDLTIAKTHGTIIRRFGQSVIRSGGLDPSFGRTLNAAQDLRKTADYERQPIDAVHARELVERMEQFLTALDTFIRERTS